MDVKMLEEIRKRAEAATPGPWREVNLYIESGDANERLAEVCESVDATFIAHAREDVPKLLAEVKRLKQENNTLRGNVATIEKLTKCADTKDFAKRALNGDATIRI
jgi:hypothetical protein